jgi:hypothetical protein
LLNLNAHTSTLPQKEGKAHASYAVSTGSGSDWVSRSPTPSGFAKPGRYRSRY